MCIINPFNYCTLQRFLHFVMWFLIVNGLLRYMFVNLSTSIFSFILFSSAFMFWEVLCISWSDKACIFISAFVALFIFKNANISHVFGVYFGPCDENLFTKTSFPQWSKYYVLLGLFLYFKVLFIIFLSPSLLLPKPSLFIITI